MSRSKKTVEWLKTVLIIILVLLALFMAPQIEPLKSLLTGMSIGEVRERLSDKGAQADTVFTTEIDMSAPMRMAYTTREGRTGFQYSGEVYRRYEAVSTTVSEALGSAVGFENVDEQQWRDALGKPGLYLDYGGDIPATMLASWLGIDVPVDVQSICVRRIILTEENDAVKLYIMTGENEFILSTTAVRFASISGSFASLEANGAFFAFEDDSYFQLSPYTMILNQEYSVRKAHSNVEAVQDALFDALDFNPDTATLYSEGDGTVVYVENESTVRISAEGNLSFKTFAQNDGVRIYPEETDVSAAAMAAVAIGERMGLVTNSTRPYVTRVDEGSNAVTVEFGCTVEGIPVYYDESAEFMSITVTDGVITYFGVTMLTLTLQEETEYLMPERIAQAAADSNGGEMVMAYLSDGRAVWMMR